MSNENRTNAYKLELDYALREMLASQVDVADERVSHAALSEETQAHFERSVMTMRRRLMPYAREQAVREIWEAASLEAIPYYCHRVRVVQNGVGHFGIKPKDETVVEHADIGQLERWCDVMVQIYSKLGFTPEAEHMQQEAQGEYSDILENAPESD